MNDPTYESVSAYANDLRVQWINEDYAIFPSMEGGYIARRGDRWWTGDQSDELCEPQPFDTADAAIASFIGAPR